MRGAFLAAFLVFAVILSGFVVVSPKVSAWMPTENTWISDDDGLATDPGNWENGTPFMDSLLWFTGEHNGNCTWDFPAGINMAWGTNINRWQGINFVDGYNGSVVIQTYFYIYQGIIPFPVDPGVDPHYPGPFDWLNMSNSMFLLVVLVVGGILFMLILAIISRRR